MEKTFNPGDRVFIKSSGECIRATVVEATAEEVTVRLEELSHTPVIAKYDPEQIRLCDEDDLQEASGKSHPKAN
jgi:hypothetical protein